MPCFFGCCIGEGLYFDLELVFCGVLASDEGALRDEAILLFRSIDLEVWPVF